MLFRFYPEKEFSLVFLFADYRPSLTTRRSSGQGCPGEQKTYSGEKKKVFTTGKIINVDQIISISGTVIVMFSFSFDAMYSSFTIIKSPEPEL